MTEYTDIQIPSDDEFTSFLEGITDQPDSSIDVDALSENIETTLQKAFGEVGFYQTVDGEDSARDEYEEQLADIVSSGLNGQLAEIVAQNSVQDKIRSETAALAIIKATLASIEYGILTDTLTPEDIARKKAKLYADLRVKYHYHLHDPLFEVVNIAIPGPAIEANDPNLSPFLLAAKTESEAGTGVDNDEWDEAQLVAEACLFIGVDSKYNALEYEKVKIAVTQLISVGRLDDGGSNAAANREERIRSMARSLSLEQDLTNRILQFIEQKFPIT